jgi:hypothetical protein
MPCKVKSCTCKHNQQDEWYGIEKRVMNKKAGEKKIYVCTVCTREHDEGSGDDKKKK